MKCPFCSTLDSKVINKRKSRRNAEKYTMPQNRKRKFQKGE